MEVFVLSFSGTIILYSYIAHKESRVIRSHFKKMLSNLKAMVEGQGIISQEQLMTVFINIPITV